MAVTRECDDLDKEIDSLLNDGYRLDMIKPADAPREVQLSKNGDIVRLVSEPSAIAGGLSRHHASSDPKGFFGQLQLPLTGGGSDRWIIGRAGMMYRDLLADRLGGRLIASHIRLSTGGPVPDYVHYHKIDFQLIYCLKGRIRVVYEDQGEPFWLEPRDCVLQPPEIRHRVLECEAGSEVLELSSPAEHETWVEHEISLPTPMINRERLFGGQRFVRSVASEAVWSLADPDGVVERDLGIFEATNGLVDVRIRRSANVELMMPVSPRPGMTGLGFVVAGREKGEAVSVHSVNDEIGTNDAMSTDILWLEFRDDGKSE